MKGAFKGRFKLLNLKSKIHSHQIDRFAAPQSQTVPQMRILWEIKGPKHKELNKQHV